MTEPSTGLYWTDGVPFLGLGAESAAPAGPGAMLCVAVEGPRGCVGHWRRGAGRQSCPFGERIEATATDAQCVACGNADAGRQVARDRAHDDGSPYRLYLAWFGDETIKVGICSAARGTNRLTEQGALAYTFIADGTLAPIRAAEQTISGAGIATERVRLGRKPQLWWSANPETGRARLLAAADQAGTAIADLPKITTASPEVMHHTRQFGLDGELPSSYRPLTAVESGSVLGGRVLVASGRSLLLDTERGAVLLDARLIAGWRLTTSESAPSRLPLGLPVHPATSHATQPTLF